MNTETELRECRRCVFFGCTSLVWPVEGARVSQLNVEALEWFDRRKYAEGIKAVGACVGEKQQQRGINEEGKTGSTCWLKTCKDWRHQRGIRFELGFFLNTLHILICVHRSVEKEARFCPWGTRYSWRPQKTTSSHEASTRLLPRHVIESPERT